MEFLPPPPGRPSTVNDPDPTPVPKDGIRALMPMEIQTLEPIFAMAGHPLPDPAISAFIGSVENGEVVAFIVLQLRLHAEPMWIKPGHSAVFSSLVHAAEAHILAKTGPQWVYLFAPPGKVHELAKAAGMYTEPWAVMSKLVQPKTAGPIVDLMPPEEEGQVQ